MAHGDQCENARGRHCECDCQATGHAAGRVRVVTASGSSTDRQLVDDWVGVRRWKKVSTDGVPNGRTEVTRERAAVESVVAEIVVHLIDEGVPEGRAEATRKLTDGISSGLVTAVGDALSSSTSNKISGHFWCSVLASICKAYDSAVGLLKQDLNTVATKVVEVLRGGSASEGTVARGAAPREVESSARSFEAFARDLIDESLKGLIEKALIAIVSAGEALGEEAVMKYVRIVGMLICPDPSTHPAVVRYCIWPLIEGPLRDAVPEELREWIRTEYLGFG